MTTEYERIVTTHPIYNDNAARWQYLKESYLGGDLYKNGEHLSKYLEESDEEYEKRISSTPLDNHCNSVISVYNSFLFREEPLRDFGQLDSLPETEAFLKDADLSGRSLDNFMKEVSTWASVYGHCWMMLVKPNTNADTRADELAQGVRPYVSLMTPLTVIDWEFTKQDNGVYILTMLKYIEHVSGAIQTIKEWTVDEIFTFTVDTVEKTVSSIEIENNEINKIPSLIAYNKRSTTPNTGVSDIADISDAQKFIYNLNSEIEQSVRIDGHPTAVTPEDVNISGGAGSVVTMPANMNPELKPYLLKFDGGSIESMLATIETTVDSIDRMANTGAIRATEAKVLSGVAQQQEFQLLNARLSDKADNLEQAEEVLWRLFAQYLNKAWDGEVEYPGSFNIQDTQNEFTQLQSAKGATDNTQVHALIDRKIVELLGEDPDEILTGEVQPVEEQDVENV